MVCKIAKSWGQMKRQQAAISALIILCNQVGKGFSLDSNGVFISGKKNCSEKKKWCLSMSKLTDLWSFVFYF